MNTPTPITATHLALVRDMAAEGQYLSRSIEHYAQEIADSEARATAEVVNALTCTHHNDAMRAACPVCLVATLRAERDQLRAEVAWWKNWHEENEKLEDGIAVKVQATIDGLRAEVERLKNQRDNLLKPMRDAATARAERAEAELATERARLDWLEKRGPWESFNKWGETGISLRENIRAAIDAAMKEGAK